MVSGAEQRRRRAAQGLPRLSDADRASRRLAIQRHIARKCEINNAEKLRRGCADCGYRDHPEALEWDHLPGFEKLANVSKLAAHHTAPVARMLAEMGKCEVVCANCHRIRTFSRRNE